MVCATKGYYSMSVQLTRDEVIQAWRSLFALRRNRQTEHHAPRCRSKSTLSALQYVQSGFTLEGNRLTLSLGKSREDGICQLTLRLRHRPGVEYERVRQVSITNDASTRQLAARLVVEVKPRANQGQGRVAVDLGETVLLAAAFADGTALLYSGRFIQSIRRYWQKVRSKGKPPLVWAVQADCPPGGPPG